MLLAIKNDAAGLDWSAKGDARIAQNVLNLISTMRYEIPYNRTLGIPKELFDKPAAYAIAQLQTEITELVSRYEPRASMQSVVCTVGEEGNIVIEVVIEV